MRALISGRWRWLQRCSAKVGIRESQMPISRVAAPSARCDSAGSLAFRHDRAPRPHRGTAVTCSGGAVAQLGERLVRNEKVRSSILLGSTNFLRQFLHLSDIGATERIASCKSACDPSIRSLHQPQGGIPSAHTPRSNRGSGTIQAQGSRILAGYPGAAERECWPSKLRPAAVPPKQRARYRKHQEDLEESQ